MNNWGDAAFNPRSIALVGASAKSGKLGHILMRNLLEGYPGKLYPINPGETEIMGHRAYQRLQDVPQQIDLVVIALPTEACVAAMRDCANVGAIAALVLSGELQKSGQRVRLDRKRCLKRHAQAECA